MVVDVAGERVELLPERAARWGDVLLVADLHLGKGAVFRARGVPVPDGDLADDLDRLRHALERSGAARLLVLGDLVHGPVTAAVAQAVARWRETVPHPILLVRGNHDRHQRELPPAWRMEAVDGVLREGPFAFAHHPVAVPGAYTWCGHVHPAVVLRGKADALRLPCFHLGAEVGVLPAFGTFTGGVTVRRAAGDRVFAVVGEVVREVEAGSPLRAARHPASTGTRRGR